MKIKKILEYIKACSSFDKKKKQRKKNDYTCSNYIEIITFGIANSFSIVSPFILNYLEMYITLMRLYELAIFILQYSNFSILVGHSDSLLSVERIQ